MNEETYYLRPDVYLEPLFNKWYTWPHNIAPATAAMHVANHHIKIMKSFISNPKAHQAALKNPALMGGPFLDYPTERVDDIKELLARTLSESEDLITFSKAYHDLDKKLSEEAQGFSLESLYKEIPPPLRGYVELLYDLNNNPSLRFFEPLLYRSPYYKESAQSISLGIMQGDERPFVMSTPRFPDEHHLHLEMPFKHELVDFLFRMRNQPRSMAEIKEALEGIETQGGLSIESLLTQSPPQIAPGFDGDGVRIRYYNHATILIETPEVTILTDPVISYSYDTGLPRFTFLDLPETIDYVLITHDHVDHVQLETLLQIRHKIRNIIVPRNNQGAMADPSLKLMLQKLGFTGVRDLEILETIDVPDGQIVGLPFLGEHADLNIYSKIAYFVQLKGRSVLALADSSNLDPELYRHLHSIIGETDVIFLGMECQGGPMSWLHGPLLTRSLSRKMDNSRRFTGADCEHGMGIINQFNARQVFIYAMGVEPWLSYFMGASWSPNDKPIVESNKFIEQCQAKGLEARRLLGSEEILL